MRLTTLLCARDVILRRLYAGKHRIAREVRYVDKRLLLERLAREEETLFYLRQPYLTNEQEKIWMEKESLEEPKRYAQMLHKRGSRNMYKSVTFEERLEHFRVNEAWE